MKKKTSRESPDKIAESLFDASVTSRERAIFEGGIALGALYHQFLGVPIVKEKRLLRLLERAIAETMSLQPYKEQVTIRIRDSEVHGSRSNPYDYSELQGRMLEAEVVAAYGGCRATVAMRYVPALKYNLMYIERVESPGDQSSRRSLRDKV